MDQANPYEAKRRTLQEKYMASDAPPNTPLGTDGVHHLVLISSDLDATVAFYTSVLGMRLTKVVVNRDDPSSTHIFLDMGGGNMLAFFDFPKKGPAKTERGIGSMHHVALKGTSEQYVAVVKNARDQGIEHDIHGGETKGSIYMRDPDGILVEVTTGY